MKDLTKDYPAIAAAIREAMVEHFSELDPYGCFDAGDVRAIECESRDGFMAFTNGGLDCTVLQCLDNHYEAHGKHAAIIAPYVERAYKDAAQAFIESREDLADAFEAREDQAQSESEWLLAQIDAAESAHAAQSDLFEKVPFYQTQWGSIREEFHEAESEWLSEGGEYWLQGRAHFYAADNYRNKQGADEVYFFAGVNTDFTYGRDKGIEETFQRSYKAARLTPARVRIIVKAMVDSINEEGAQ